MMISLVQSWFKQNSTTSSSVTLPTPGSTITVGNLVIAFVAYASGATITTPSGWTQIDALNESGIGIWVGMGIVQNSDNGSYTFTASGTADYLDAVAYEISGAPASPIISFAHSGGPGDTTTPSTSATAPGQLCLSACAQNAGTGGAASFNTPSGWTLDHDLNGTAYHDLGSAHQALTGSGGSQSCAWVNNATSGENTAASIVIIGYPAPPSGFLSFT